MRIRQAGWAVTWTLVLAGAAGAMAHVGCTSVYDEFYKPFTEAGGGGAGAAGPGGGMVSPGGAGGCGTDCCSTAEDCPDLGVECVERTCLDGTCGTRNVESGVEAPPNMQAAGDCKIIVCDGAGATKVLDDGGDLPDDGQDCTVDLCENGAPKTAPAEPGTACDDGGGSVCDAAAHCVGCNSDADCQDGAKPICVRGTCVSLSCADGVKNGAETDVDCGGDCAEKCGIAMACAGSDANCAAGAYCAGGVCAAKLGGGVTCAGDNQCQSGLCDGTDGVCCDVDCSGTCRSCKLAGQEGQCLNIPMFNDPEDECPGATVCDGVGACKTPLGEACIAAADCAGGSCVDGTCCGSACAGACQACNLAGSMGICANIAGGDDPQDECPGATTCNGNGGCLFPNGQACASGAQCQSGTCADGVCCDVACNGLCRACNLPGSAGTCTAIPAGSDPANECPGSNHCNGQGACGDGANGVACVGNGSGCASGSCKDGFCCALACTSLCQACSMAKTGQANGTCAPVTAGTDPDDECGGSTPYCGGNGTCVP